MADCLLRIFDPKGDPDYKITASDRAIMLRSNKTHAEFQFSIRYNFVSASATMRDDCNCYRLKMIDYNKHLLRWKTYIVHLTDEQEDLIMMNSLEMAGEIRKIDYVRYSDLCDMIRHNYMLKFNRAHYGDIFCDKEHALKYDFCGVAFSFILPKWRVWRPHEEWVWCSEAVTLMLQVAYKDFGGRADENSPEDLEEKWVKYAKSA